MFVVEIERIYVGGVARSFADGAKSGFAQASDLCQDARNLASAGKIGRESALFGKLALVR